MNAIDSGRLGSPTILAASSDRSDQASAADVYLDQSCSKTKQGQGQCAVSGAGALSLDDVEPVSVQLRRLSVSVDLDPSWLKLSTYQELLSTRLGRPDEPPPSKTLLHSVWADFLPGSLTAIIGGSGSGKTTLLHAMAERLTEPRAKREGTISFNGWPGIDNVRHACVMQQDILLPTLTARETLQYAAKLRLPPSTPSHERSRLVEHVIRELGLGGCADTRLGGFQRQGCSRAEKRRVSIGVQLLTNPSVLLLEEPATGLDATDTFQLVRLLQGLVQKGRTVIITMHQPRSEIWRLLDNVVVLSQGSPVYSGTRLDCLPWFKARGFELPPFINPADYVVDITAVDNRTRSWNNRAKRARSVSRPLGAHDVRSSPQSLQSPTRGTENGLRGLPAVAASPIGSQSSPTARSR